MTQGENVIYYEEENADCRSYQEDFSPERQQTTHVYKTAWDTRKSFLVDMLGYSRRDAAGVIDRLIPHQDPQYPWLYAQSAKLLDAPGIHYEDQIDVYDIYENPVTVDAMKMVQRDAAGYLVHPETGEDRTSPGFARYAITYANLPYMVISGLTGAGADGGPTLINELMRYVDRQQTYATEAIQLAKGAFVWKDSLTLPILEPTTHLFGTKELTYVWHQVPRVPETAIQNCIGKINSQAFDTQTQNNGWGFEEYTAGFPAGTLLFLAPNVVEVPQMVKFSTGNRQQQGEDGGKTRRTAYRITYKFIYRPTGWNFLFKGSRPGSNPAVDPGFYEVVRKNDTTKGIYETADFITLFGIP